MKKIIKCILSLSVLLTSLIAMPNIKNVLSYTESKELDRTGWTGKAYDKNSKEEKANNGSEGDGPVAWMLDGSLSTRWHNDWSAGKASLPIYIFIDLNSEEGLKQFNTFSWANRPNYNYPTNLKKYKFYVNEGTDNLIPTTDGGITYTHEQLENMGWTLAIDATNDSSKEIPSQAGDSKVALGKTYTGSQVLIVATESHNGNQSSTDLSCDEFKLYLDLVSTNLDKTNWTGIAFDKDGQEEQPENGTYPNDGPIKHILDNNANTIFHTNYNNSNYAKLPLYMYIDLNGEKTFNGFQWQNRGSDSARDYEFYINRTSDNLIPSDPSVGVTNVADGWELISASSIEGQLNTNSNAITEVLFNKSYTARQIMVRVLSTNNNSTSSHVTCKNFELFTLDADKYVKKVVKYGNTLLNDDDYVRESFYDSTINGQLIEGDSVPLGEKGTFAPAVAKYVSSKVLSVKAQSAYADDGDLNVRFITSIPSVNLEKLKFKVEVLKSGVLDKAKEVKTNRVFGSIVADGVSISDAASVFDNTISTHFAICKLNNISKELANDESTVIRVTPYWLPYGYSDNAENYVEGKVREFTTKELFDGVNAETVSEVE